jgi:protein involved in polysaccharide export with SLBB domain
MTESEVEDAIVRAYAEAQILPKAIVSVSVVESQNRIYSISGAVSTPGAYPLQRGDLRLLEAVANARGATSETGVDYVYIIRHKHDGSGNNNTTAPAGEPGTPGRDPLAPQGAITPSDRPMFALSLQAQPAPQTPEEARAAAERLANELREARGTEAPPVAPAAVDPATTPTDDTTRRDRVIEIEGAGAQPAQPGDAGVTTIPPSNGATPGTTDAMTPAPTADAAAGTGNFEFTAPAEPTDQEIIRVPFAQLKRGELKYNVIIQPQDMIIIPYPTFGTYYMGGHVLRTGAYNLPPDGMTLKQAIDSAGGLDQLAIPARTDVIRRIGPNQEMFVRVDLERIFTGMEPDIYLKANDSVRVGTNLGAPFAAALRNAFRVTYGFGFLYDRNYAPSNQNQ